MRNRIATTLATVLIVLLWAAGAQALNILGLDPVQQDVRLGDQAFLDLRMNFDDTTLGGGIVFDYDMGIVWLSSTTFDGALPDDPDFRCPGSSVVQCPQDPNFLSFGTFAGLSGANSVARLTFDTHELGSTEVLITIDRSFSDGVGMPLDVMTVSATINVIPEPSTFALLALGGLGLGLMRRRSFEG